MTRNGQRHRADGLGGAAGEHEARDALRVRLRGVDRHVARRATARRGPPGATGTSASMASHDGVARGLGA